jgi:hypothetical protein
LVVLIALVGCAQPTAPPEQFVGTWVGDYGEEGPRGGVYGEKLSLRGDGKGSHRQPWDPHEQSIMWVLRGDKFIMTPRSGGTSMTWQYRFDGPDRLVLVGDDGREARLRRLEPASDEAAAGASSVPGEPAEEEKSPEVH